MHEVLHNWQIGRARNDEDPYDWPAFRQYAVSAGLQDPGAQAFSEFRSFNAAEHHVK